MVKKHKVGRSLVKKHDGLSVVKSDRHTTTATNDFSRLPIRSITEETNLSEFFNIAELANTDFSTQKTSFRFLSSNEIAGLSHSSVRCNELQKVQDEKRDLLRIPRRPHWDRTTSADELNNREKEELLNWRRTLAALEQQTVGLVLTPFEKNIELWRQLWRVVERCDVLVQIVDARQPLLYYCQDLERYAREVDRNKVCLVLVNKSDLLSVEQRSAWHAYFTDLGIRAIFWSAKMVVESADGHPQNTGDVLSTIAESEADSSTEGEMVESPDSKSDDIRPISDLATPAEPHERHTDNHLGNDHGLLNATELLDLLSTDVYAAQKPRINPPHLTVGFIGYPNVGKSSTMNALMGCKKTAVSATPGRTKHYQTLQVRTDLTLCDCPGLVLPSFAYSKSDLVLAGILSIDELRDFLSPIGLLCERIPRPAMEFKYGIDLSTNPDNPNSNDQSPPTPHQLLAAHAFSHGFRTAKGNPHYDRSARLILKDYVQGRLLYCHPPPDMDPNAFQYLGRDHQAVLPPSLTYAYLAKQLPKQILTESTTTATSSRKEGKLDTSDPALITAFDRLAFQKMDSTNSHIRCRKKLTHTHCRSSRDADVDDTQSVSSWITVDSTVDGSVITASVAESDAWSAGSTTNSKKPWRQMSNGKRANGKGRDKLRRVYAQLDQHEQT